MDLGLRDRVFIVTGGSRGLGRAAARQLVDEGARVVVSARSQEPLTAVVRELGSSAAVAVAADNGDERTPDRLINAARSTWGRLDGALISVGGPPPGSVADIRDEQWRAAFESVFVGAVRLARAVVGATEAGASVAFVLSSSVRQPIRGLALSNGLRPGLAMVAKTMADELGPKGVRVNGLLPGRIDTERVRELDAAAGSADEARAKAIEVIPLGRYGTPEEFGRIAAFVLSPAASYLSGAMIQVDGGAMRPL